MSADRLEVAATYAMKHGGGSGCIIRHGYLVKEWGDPARLPVITPGVPGVYSSC